MKPNTDPTVNRPTKKDLVVGDKKPNRRINPLVFIIVAAALIGAVGASYYITRSGGPARPVAVAGDSTAGATEVSYPLTLFADGKARHFDFQANGLTIRYFILKSADGVVRAAFDACDVCWPAGKGYVQDGDVMVCRNCNRRFASDKINEVKGGCNPAPLNRTVQEDRLVIRVADLLQGQSYFDFKRKV